MKSKLNLLAMLAATGALHAGYEIRPTRGQKKPDAEREAAAEAKRQRRRERNLRNAKAAA